MDCVLRYDPRSDTWTELPPMLIARSGAACCVLDSHIYIIGKIRTFHLLSYFFIKMSMHHLLVSFQFFQVIKWGKKLFPRIK